MKNDAAKARNANTRVRIIKPRKLKPGEMLAEDRLVAARRAAIGECIYPYRRRPIIIDLPLFLLSELRLGIGLLFKCLASLLLVDVAASGAKRARQTYRNRRAVKAGNRIKKIRVQSDSARYATAKAKKPDGALPGDQLLPLDFSASDWARPEPEKAALVRRPGRPVGSRDKQPRKRRS